MPTNHELLYASALGVLVSSVKIAIQDGEWKPSQERQKDIETATAAPST